MNYRKKLFSIRNIYDLKNTEDLFLGAVRENAAFQQNNCPDYARLLKAEGFEPGSIRSAEDICRIPVLPTLFFKSHELYSMDESAFKIHATSSGTKGKKSNIGLDRDTYRLGIRMVIRTFFRHNIISPVPANYIVLGYEPSKQNRMGAVQTAYGTTRFAPALHREYALKFNGSDYELNIEGVKNALVRYDKMGFPVRFVGFPGYMYFLVRTLQENGIRLRLNSLSKVLLGGGWKQFSAERIDKKELYRLIYETLGIREENCREFFSAVEHPVAYCDCRHHHFHVPIYSRVIIRDADTLTPLPNGEKGLLSFVTPLVKSMPLLCVVTDDLAVMRDGAECGCGIDAPYFEILGRAGIQDIKTCAAGAAEILGGAK
jgi:phenylacetate-coenzyme A ligase PaaK-like adenylate-forming protein